MSDEVIVTREADLVNRMPVRLEAPQGTPVHLCPSSLPRDVAGIIRRLNAMGQSTLTLGRDGTVEMLLEHFLAYPREQADEQTGEVHQFTWLVLIDARGESFGTSSPVVAGKVWQLWALKSAGLVPWPCPVQIVTRKAMKSGRSYHDVIVLGPDERVTQLDSEPPPPGRKNGRAK